MTGFKEVFGDAKVFYRIYPSENSNWENFRILQDEKVIQIHRPCSRLKTNPGEQTFKQFETDGIFRNTIQETIFSKVMNGVIESVFEGQNAIIVAFGQTGSGKSLTISGLHHVYQDRGLLPRINETIFTMKDQLPNHLQVNIEISYVEILSMLQARDLLKPYPGPVNKRNINKLVKKIAVMNDVQTLEHIFMAEGRKEFTYDSTYPAHQGSSIFTFYFIVKNMDLSNPHNIYSKLHIVDLAGNDVFGDKSSSFKISRQVGIANSTKSFMEYFMLLLCETDNELVRIKEKTNIVTQYLGTTFSRNSLLRFIGHLKVGEENISLALSFLRFGQILKNLKPQGTSVVLKTNELMEAALLQKKLDNMCKEKMLSEMIQNKQPKDKCIGQEKIKQIRDLIEEFVKNQIDEIDLVENGNIEIILKVLKAKIIVCEEERASLSKAIGTESIEVKTSEPEIQIGQKSGSLKSRTSDIEKTQSFMSPTSSMRRTKSSHSKRITSQSKHRKHSMISDTENRSTSKKGKMSNSGVSGPKRIKPALSESLGTIEKSSKKILLENQQASTLLSNVNLILPDVFPEHKDVLREYTLSDPAMFEAALESFKKYDAEAKNIYQDYLLELKTLNTLFGILELRKNEMIQAKLVRQLHTKKQVDISGEVIKSDLEIKCEENLKNSQQDVTNQQEMLLTLQAEFKMALAMMQQIKKDTKEDFEAFCKAKYNLLVPNLEDANEPLFENQISLEEFCDRAEADNNIPEELSKEAVSIEIFRNFKDLMYKEAKKKALYLKKSIRWLKNTNLIRK